MFKDVRAETVNIFLLFIEEVAIIMAGDMKISGQG